MKPPVFSKKATKTILLNADRQPLTVEKLLSLPGCGHYSVEEAIIIVQSIQSLAAIFLDLHREKSICIDNQQVVYLNSENEDAKLVSINNKNKAA